VDDQRLAEIAAELALTVDELREARSVISPGLDEALAGALIRFEDALFELSQ
jgi:hypothetical protein